MFSPPTVATSVSSDSAFSGNRVFLWWRKLYPRLQAGDDDEIMIIISMRMTLMIMVNDNTDE